MSYQSDLYSALSGEASITAIVGSRIYADIADASATAPYLVYQVTSTSGETTHGGTRDVEFPSIQFSCWATGKASAIALASALNTFLDGATIAGSSDLSLVFSNQFGQYEPDTKLFGEIIEYQAATNTN